MPINRMIGSNYNNSPSRIIYSDRFIPSRSGSNFAVFDISNSPASDQGKKTVLLLIKAFYAPRCLGPIRRVLRLPAMFSGYDESGPGISHSPVTFLVSDAPGLEDDFYLNLVDWSPNNVLAVGLESCVYFWNACSIKYLFGWVGLNVELTLLLELTTGQVQIWDASNCRIVEQWKGIDHVLGFMTRAFFIEICVLGMILPVCGLKWSYDERELASVGNENRLHVWNQHSAQPVLKHCEHTASVSATHK
ncbi:hypothetical protein GOBAR_DD29268 [Gossypium barbadense]|nr:hypothetical protein GOBAR_DD29268 [Gossypium barbadense]